MQLNPRSSWIWSQVITIYIVLNWWFIFYRLKTRRITNSLPSSTQSSSLNISMQKHLNCESKSIFILYLHSRRAICDSTPICRICLEENYEFILILKALCYTSIYNNSNHVMWYNLVKGWFSWLRRFHN